MQVDLYAGTTPSTPPIMVNTRRCSASLAEIQTSQDQRQGGERIAHVRALLKKQGGPGFGKTSAAPAALGRRGYFVPITIESGPTRCSTQALLKPASCIQPMQSAAV